MSDKQFKGYKFTLSSLDELTLSSLDELFPKLPSNVRDPVLKDGKLDVTMDIIDEKEATFFDEWLQREVEDQDQVIDLSYVTSEGVVKEKYKARITSHSLKDGFLDLSVVPICSLCLQPLGKMPLFHFPVDLAREFYELLFWSPWGSCPHRIIPGDYVETTADLDTRWDVVEVKDDGTLELTLPEEDEYHMSICRCQVIGLWRSHIDLLPSSS
jgi:hypothetical protein